jgi:hypothetical protein
MTEPLRRCARFALIIGVAGGAACVVGLFVDRVAFFEAYLIAWWFYLGISLGAFAVLMVHHLTGGHWGEHVRPPLEAAVRALPALALLSVPLFYGLPDVYSWARPNSALTDPALQEVLRKKSWYLNEGFFLERNAAYFAVWLLLALIFSRAWKQRSTPRAWSAVGLIVYALSVTFAAVDWIMSLVPQWYSSILGLLSGVGQSLAGFAFGILGAALLPKLRAGAQRASASEFNDLGNLLLMFVMLWTYLAFSQYLVIWSEDLRYENAWYLPRVQTSWRWMGLFLIAFHFAIPFFVLLFRQAKQRVQIMVGLGGGLLFVHWIDTLWVISPSLHPDGVYFHWLTIATTLAIGGLWFSAVAWLLDRSFRAPATPVLRTSEAKHG